MEILGKSKRAKLKVDPNVITEAVAKHIETSNFPKKTEVKRIRATNAYYQEKVKQHNKVIETGQNQIEDLEFYRWSLN